MLTNEELGGIHSLSAFQEGCKEVVAKLSGSSSLMSGASLGQCVSSWCFISSEPWHLMQTKLLNVTDRCALVEWLKEILHSEAQ